MNGSSKRETKAEEKHHMGISTTLELSKKKARKRTEIYQESCALF